MWPAFMLVYPFIAGTVGILAVAGPAGDAAVQRVVQVLWWRWLGKAGTGACWGARASAAY